jgi:hypothetical protein
MRRINFNDLSALLAHSTPPCISLYLPVDRGQPGKPDALRYKNLVNEAERSLRQKYPAVSPQPLLQKFRDLPEDGRLWGQCQGGLAVLGAGDEVHAFAVPRTVPERAVVAGSFHIKPLLRFVQSADRFQVLCLTRSHARMFEGTRDGLEEITVPGLPASAEVFLYGRQPQPVYRGGGYAGAVGMGGTAGRGNVPGGPSHPARDETRKEEAELYFQAVSRAVLDKASRPSGLPLVLAALPENQALFRAANHNPHLLPCTIERDPGPMSDEDLCRQAWKCVEPMYLERLRKLSDDFGVARSRGQGSAKLSEAARAAFEGRVYVLLVEAERTISGQIDMETGKFRPGDGSPTEEDALDDLAELVLRRKGSVVIVPRERMPTESGLAATFRF